MWIIYSVITTLVLNVIVTFQAETIDLSMYGMRIFGDPDPSVGADLDAYNPQSHKMNPEEMGSYLEGDLLSPIAGDGRNGLISETNRWSNAIVPFIVNGSFTPTQWSYIDNAMQTYHNNTCVRFVHRTHQVDFLSIESDGTGCWSAIGRRGNRQVMNLQAPSCVRRTSTAIHELMHVLGFFHEHNRYDRDSYVYVNYTNMKPEGYGNYKKLTETQTTTFNVTYDYDSILHYSAYGYSKNGQPTLVPLVPAPQIGKAVTLSSKDIMKIRRMYKCPGAW